MEYFELCAPLKDLLVCLGRDDAVHGALRSTVRAEDRHAGAQLAAPRKCLGRPAEIIHAPRELRSGLMLEEQVEAPSDLVRTLHSHNHPVSKLGITQQSPTC